MFANHILFISFVSPAPVSAHKGHNRSADWLFDKMKYLGHLIDFDIDSANEYLEFQEILDNYDYNEATRLFDPTARMESVNIKCHLNLFMNELCVGENG